MESIQETEICLCCLAEGFPTKRLSDRLDVEGREETISDLLSECLNREVLKNDNYPQSICISCVGQIRDACMFRAMVANSWNALLVQEKTSTSDNSNNIFVLNDHVYSIEYDMKLSNKETVETPTNESPNINIKSNVFDPSNPRKLHSQSNKTEESQTIYCTVCLSQFSTRQKLHVHCSSFHKVEKAVGRFCDCCDDRFPDYRSLLIHRQKHFTPYVCEACWQGFTLQQDLEHHFQTCKKLSSANEEVPQEVGKQKLKKNKQCHVCGKSYSADYINVHMLIHSKGKYKCKFCNKLFRQPCNLNSHIVWNHTKEKNYRCDGCDSVFITSSSRAMHVRRVHLKEKKWSCSACKKSFFCKAELQKHFLCHTGVRNFACVLCNKSYLTRYALTYHINHNHTKIVVS